MNSGTDYSIKHGAALAIGLLCAVPASAQMAGVSGSIVDEKGYLIRNVIVSGDGLFDTTDAAGKFGAGRGPVVGLRGAAQARPQGPALSGSHLRFTGLGRGATLKAELLLASGRRGAALSLPAAAGAAQLDLDALAAGLPREGLYVLRVDAGNGAEHHLLARVAGGSWNLSSPSGSAALSAGKAALRKSAVPAKLTLSKPGYATQEITVPAGGVVGRVVLKLNPAATEVEAPFDVAPLFYPTGWSGDHKGVKAVDETSDIRPTDPDAKNTRWTYAADTSLLAMNWAAVIWQYPASNWGAMAGRKVIGASKITFWAKGAAGNEAIDFKAGNATYMTPADPGSYKDTFVAAMTANLTTEWKKYEIPLEGSNTSMVLFGFTWAATQFAGNAPISFQIDEVRFE